MSPSAGTGMDERATFSVARGPPDGTQRSIGTGTVLDVLPTFTIKLAMITIKQVRRMAP